MREIKFRAWHPTNKVMHIFDLIKAASDVYIAQHFIELLNNTHCEGSDLLMQYAGTKNGIELYEGDVIRDHIGIGVIGWSERNFAFKVRYTGRYSSLGKWFADYLESEESSIELIGNIHENPELLEKNND